MYEKPWMAGPRELLVHGLQHLDLDTDFDNRMAMISIDNSIELMIKTYLGLPKRISNIEGLSRRRLQEITANFPALLDGLEEFGGDKLNGIDLGDIEWFHRIRNQLYHDGNGITVEKEKVEVYGEMAKILFENLFDHQIIEMGNETLHHSLTGEFIKLWADLERPNDSDSERPVPAMHRIQQMIRNGELSEKQAEKLQRVRHFRNHLVHGVSSPTESELKESLTDLKAIHAALKSNE